MLNVKDELALQNISENVAKGISTAVVYGYGENQWITIKQALVDVKAFLPNCQIGYVKLNALDSVISLYEP